MKAMALVLVLTIFVVRILISIVSCFPINSVSPWQCRLLPILSQFHHNNTKHKLKISHSITIPQHHQFHYPYHFDFSISHYPIPNIQCHN
ncbi:hypothetical protein LINPERHAP2_LOCUS19793 [Linum perenne]